MARLVVAELSVLPLGTAKTGLSDYIAAAVKEVRRKEVKHQLHAMGTVFEASSVEEAFGVAQAAHEAVIAAGAKRVVTTLRIDDRLDLPKTMGERVRSVEERLG